MKHTKHVFPNYEKLRLFGPGHQVQNVNMVENSRKIGPKWSVSYIYIYIYI